MINAFTADELRSLGASIVNLAEYIQERPGPVEPSAAEVGSLCSTGLISVASAELAERKLRNRFIDDRVPESAWIMLLDLYVQRGRGRAVSITSACLAAGAPQSTSHRYIQVLAEEGLIRRVANHADRRSSNIELTDHGRAQIESYLRERSAMQARPTDEAANDVG